MSRNQGVVGGVPKEASLSLKATTGYSTIAWSVLLQRKAVRCVSERRKSRVREISGFRIARRMVRRMHGTRQTGTGWRRPLLLSWWRASVAQTFVKSFPRSYPTSHRTSVSLIYSHKKTVCSFKLNLPKLSVVGVGSMSDRIPIVVVGVDTNTHAVLLKSNAEEVFWAGIIHLWHSFIFVYCRLLFVAQIVTIFIARTATSIVEHVTVRVIENSFITLQHHLLNI